MDSKTYLEQSARTASSQFHTDKIDPAMLQAGIVEAMIAGDHLDQLKKTLYYGKELPKSSPYHFYKDRPCELNQHAINPDIFHAALGLYTEAAELLEACLKAMQGESFDEVNAFEECGDAEWYLAMLYRVLGKTPEEAKAANIAKLKTRYPDKFTTKQAVERDLDAEREVLERHG